MGAEPAPDCRGPLNVSSSSRSRSRSRVGWGLEEEVEVESWAAAMAPDEDDDDDSQGKGKKKGGWWPPGFRFHPTDEELVLFYLKRKICRRRFRLPIIADLDVYKLDPWDLPDKSKLRSGDKQWYFFSPRDKKYPNGSRSNRATNHGYWKATGKDRTISQDSRGVGNKKTLVYYHGRAPRGKRTDWVMHEYTMDEKVLASYNNVQDSYALYKLFRKSGLGPKNGEQYGAPFREEEWDDGDDTIDDNLRNPNNREGLLLDQPNNDSLSNMSDNNRDMLPIGVLEEFLPQMSSEQDVVQQYSEAAAFFSEVDFEGDTGSCLAPHVEVTSAEYDDTWCQAGNMDISFEIAQLTSADPNPIVMSQIMSFSSCIDQGQLRAGEEFLEIEDFNNPETGIWNTGDTSRRDQAQETNGLHDLDDYFDASMFIAEAMGPLDGATSNSYFGTFGDDEGQNQACHITTELWAHEQALSLPAIEPNQITMASSSSGIVNAHTLPAVGEQTLGQVSLARGGSALSAFLESIPSHPALASENALISRAFVRVSSFGARQMRAGDQNTLAGGRTTVGRRGGNNGGGFLFVSLLVGLGAILWVLTIGAAVKVVKGLWGRFISS